MTQKKSINSKVLYIIYFAIGARILTIVKDMLTASKIGANDKMDSYLLAFGAIMLLTKIIGDGIVVSLIPILQEIQHKHGTDRRMNYTNNLLNITIIVSLGVIVIGFVAAPLIVKLFGPGFKGLELRDSVLLFKLGLPMVALTWIRAIGAGFLQAEHAFRAGAKGGVSSVLVYIIYLLLFIGDFGIRGLMVVGSFAIISQIYIIFKAMKKIGYKYEWKLNLRDNYLPKVIKVLLPILAGISINEVNNAVDTAIASTLPSGSIAELSYANDIISLFLGLFISAIVTVLFPIMSESYNKGEEEKLKNGVKYYIKTILTLTLPISILLILIPDPIVKIFFERGAFDAEASFLTAKVLGYYALGLPAMAILPLITRAYYSIRDMRRPVVISILSLILNIVVDLLLAPTMGAAGLALGTSISVIFAVLLGIYNLR
ncbi:murein biosynthesis integral membrane protein MurJ [Tissierella sp.]|uniref:murein biosynthesis integral membrane protein MurJ n=1 Tax=Tissierella sp. TaxID=41274 RepID=UPI00285C359A|nr:murein biosynthesis integral membrane protein MurJ [Tissierella sp.]MDR7856991.1 murein biosynthesis integral membrane protein MurJ [Tissierella sp.]